MKVTHPSLCQRRAIYKWADSYLIGIRDYMSGKPFPTGRRWQVGSVLTPLSLMVNLNNLLDVIELYLNRLSDDARILNGVRSNRKSNILQKDLDKMQQWADRWLMKFNSWKRKAMEMEKGSNRPDDSYHICGNKLQDSCCERNLGVDFMLNSSPENHVRKIVRKANYCIALQYINIETDDIHLTQARKCFISFVSSHGGLLERVQRNATRLAELSRIRYEKRREPLDLPTVVNRIRGDMITIYKS